MRANFFDDFTYYAEIDGTLHELTDSHLFGRDVKRYGNTYCYAGKNLTENDIREVMDFDVNFSEYEFLSRVNPCDLYFWGIKK